MIDMSKDYDPKTRAGERFRINTERYFYVMSQGWYLHTRDGVDGPYNTREDVEQHLSGVVSNKTELPCESWRFKKD